MTDPAVRSSALTVSTTASTSLVCTMPAGFTAGDLLLGFYLQRGTTTAADTPSGWTVLASHASGSGRSADAWGKVAAGGETLTVTKPDTSTAAVFLFAITAGTFDTVQWVEGWATLMAQSSSNTPPLPDSTTTVNGALAISVGGTRSASTTGTGMTAPGTWTQRGTGYADNDTDGMSVGGCSKTITTAGSIGSYAWSSPVSNSGPLVTVVVRPSGSTPTPSGTAEVYWWNASTSAYVLAAGVYDWEQATTDYYPASGFDEVKYWDSAYGQYFPGAVADTDPPTQPGAVVTSQITSSTITFSWGPSVDTVGVTGYRIRLNGGAWITTTDPTYPASSLSPSTSYTPEIQARDAAGNWSTTRTGAATFTAAVTDTTPPTQPGQPTATPTGSSVALSWTASTDAVGVTGYQVHRSATSGFTPSAGTLKLSPVSNSTTETGVPNGTWYYKIQAFDAAGNISTASTQRSVVVAAVAASMMIGCSSSGNDHGGTENWQGWRVYTRGEMYDRANGTAGNPTPLFLLYSEDGPNLSGTYASIYAHCIEELDTFYYGNANGTLGSGTGSNTPSIRAAIQLHWSNGNEHSDKGDLSGTHTPAKIAAFVNSQRALYDAVMYAPGGTRRYPNAYAAVDPTQNQEQSGIVADWLHPAAQYIHTVAWSMYNPGRQTTVDDPTMNWPTITRAAVDGGDWSNLTKGFLGRCFRRTWLAREQARADTGDPTFEITIACGEIGTGDTPGDTTARPYYVAIGLLGGAAILADEYDLRMPIFCYWDNQKKLPGGDWDPAAPQNVLGHGTANSVTVYGEPAGTNPSTRQALQAWPSNDPRRGGTKPAAWSANPKAGWKHTGTPV